jgi:hypothetical protein
MKMELKLGYTIVTNAFFKNGITSIEDVLSQKDYTSIFSKIDTYVKSNDHLKNRHYFSFEELPFSNEILKALVNPKLAERLKEIFDEPQLYPDFVLQVNNTPKNLIKPHFDLQSYTRHQLTDHLKDSKYAKIGFYFQPNNYDYPGSIWYVPGSHKNKFLRLALRVPFKKLRELLLIVWKKLSTRKQIPFENQPNSFAIFDGRLLHSSSAKQTKNIDNYYKYSIYFSVVGSDKDALALLKTETQKLASEFYSPSADESQRIGYVFSNPFKAISKQIKNLGLDFVDFSYQAMMSKKK